MTNYPHQMMYSHSIKVSSFPPVYCRILFCDFVVVVDRAKWPQKQRQTLNASLRVHCFWWPNVFKCCPDSISLLLLLIFLCNSNRSMDQLTLLESRLMKLKKDRGIFDIDKRKNSREQTNQNTEKEKNNTHTHNTNREREETKNYKSCMCGSFI